MSRASTVSTLTAAPVTAAADDRALVARVRDGNDRAFEVLYDRYGSRIAAFVYGYVNDHARTEDVTQEVFFSALRRMRATEQAIDFRPWIHEIARNACIDQFRRSSSRAQELSFDEGESLVPADRARLVAAGGAPEDAADDAQRLNDLYGALGDLSESHHRILVLRELEGRSYQEIGERMGISKAGVESTLFRARKRLGEQYDDVATGRRCVRVCTTVALAAETATERGRRRTGQAAPRPVAPPRRLAAARPRAAAAPPPTAARPTARPPAGPVTPWGGPARTSAAPWRTPARAPAAPCGTPASPSVARSSRPASPSGRRSVA